MIKCSVVIPALNEEEHIANCIIEVKKQIKNSEIIIADGNSSDKTREISKNLGAKVIIEKTKTVSAARDTGLRTASGDVVVFIDADVLPAPSWFEKITKPFDNPNVVAVAGMPTPLDGSFSERFGMKLIFGIFAEICFKFQTPLVTGQVMAVRRKQAIEAGGFDHTHKSGEDTYIFLLLKKKGLIIHTDATVIVSTRRIRNWGMLKYLQFNIRNWYSLLRYNKPVNDDYEPVRK